MLTLFPTFMAVVITYAVWKPYCKQYAPRSHCSLRVIVFASMIKISLKCISIYAAIVKMQTFSGQKFIGRIRVSYKSILWNFYLCFMMVRVCNEKLFFLFLSINICCGYSKEPSH